MTKHPHSSPERVVYREVMLPDNAPREYADSQTLWNAVDAAEKRKDAQTARRMLIALPKELTYEQNLALIRDYCQQEFVSKGMICDLYYHDEGDGNPHVHLLLTLRAMDEHGEWLSKTRTEYVLDERGNRVKGKNGKWKTRNINTVDWNDHKYAEIWRHDWEVMQNAALETAGRPERIDMRSLERQGIEDRLPQQHLGPAAAAMERKGTVTEMGEKNRKILSINGLLGSLRRTAKKLGDRIAELMAAIHHQEVLEKPQEHTLVEVILSYRAMREAGRESWSKYARDRAGIRDLQDMSRMIILMKETGIITVNDLAIRLSNTRVQLELIGYIHYEMDPEQQNFATLIDMLNKMDAREDDEDYKNEIDVKFEELAQKKPGHFAVRQYAKYKMAAGKTAKSILVSCGARLAVFDIQELRDITAYDELHLDTIGDKRTALFLIMSDTDASFNFLISMIYSQMFNLLCEKADDQYGGRLPVHVRCLIDEFGNIGQIPNFEKLIATIRSREISACIVLQAQSQLKAIYKDNADTVGGNCDTLLFLGGKEKTTLKEMEELLGKETIDTFNTGESRGRETSHSMNYQKLGKPLMSMDELAVLDNGKCILQLRGVRPFLSDKYDITAHPNYKYLSDSDPRNAFNVERYLSHQLKLRLEEETQVWEINVSEEEPLEELTDTTQLMAADYGGLL